MRKHIIIIIIFCLFLIYFFPQTVKAQTLGELSSISGSFKWGEESSFGLKVFRIDVSISSISPFFNTSVIAEPDGTFNSGLRIPAGTYTVTGRVWIDGNIVNPDAAYTVLEFGSYQLSIAAGESISEINFDASTVTGILYTKLELNGLSKGGVIYICGPLASDPCRLGSTERNIYYDINGSVRMLLPPGEYRVMATIDPNILVGVIPITITSGEITYLPTETVSLSAGQNLTASLTGIEITIPEVTTDGYVSVMATDHSMGILPPSEYRFIGNYYELTSTSSYTGPVTVKFTYNEADVHGQESNLKLFHWDGVSWQNITQQPVDTVSNTITGISPTLSPFTLGEPLNSPPVVDIEDFYQVNEGSFVEISAIGFDPENGILTYSWDLDNNGSFETLGQSINYSAINLDGPSNYSIRVKVTDEGGLSAIVETNIVILNLAPTLEIITAPVDPTNISININVSILFNDPAISETHSAWWDWGDNTTSLGTIDEFNGSGIVTGTHTYISPGVYSLEVMVFDDDGGFTQQSYQYIVVYDPNGGFVTGGGFIDSPAGAFPAESSFEGSANFGFVSKYQNGASTPSGQTEFKFKIANFNFKSTSYSWLVVAGARVQYKGTGSVNGDGNFGFILTAIDGEANGGGGDDKFRIKIWDKDNNDIIVYDNQIGDSDIDDPITYLVGGQIMIHNE